jgi:OFA family oxalate/formate antiporter-like MFS transporter
MSVFLVPVANILQSATGSWQGVFVVAALVNFTVVLLALFVLKPTRAGAVRESKLASLRGAAQ